jgi:hypothetical protein
VFLALSQLLDLPALAFVVIFVHLVVRLVSEGLKSQELGGVLHISELLQWSPMFIVVIFKDEGLLGLALLREWRVYLADERAHLVQLLLTSLLFEVLVTQGVFGEVLFLTALPLGHTDCRIVLMKVVHKFILLSQITPYKF